MSNMTAEEIEALLDKARDWRVDGTFQNGIFQNQIFGQTGIFQSGIFQKESFRKYFQQNRNLSEWISFKKNLLENIFSTTGIFQNGIFQRESFNFFNSKTGIFQNGIFQKESIRKESFRRNHSETAISANWNLS
jgi:hypothetical protein